MSGFFQTTFYFGYTSMFCLGLALVCGMIISSLNFYAFFDENDDSILNLAL
jgi:hypothetical protein